MREGAVVAADLYRAAVRNHARLTYDAVGAWLLESGPLPARAAAIPGLAEVLRLQDAAAQAMRQRRFARGALTLETLQARPVFAGDDIADLRPDTKNRAKELIEDLMIAANAATAERLERAGFASIRRVLGAPRRWDRIVALAATFGETLPAAPDAGGARGVPAGAPHRRPAAVPGRVAGGGQDARLGRVRGGSARRPAGGPLRPGRDRLHPLHRAQPPLSRSRDAAAGESRGCRPARRPTISPPSPRWRGTAPRRRIRRPRSNARCASRRPRSSSSRVSGERFHAIVTGASEKGTWVRTLGTPVEGRVVKGFAGLDVGDRVEVRLVGTDVDQGFIDFATV